jgi:alkylhydroperoxidase/carboxymuconolactone decarboxylase family protein YurZ
MSENETMRKGSEMRRRLLGDAWVERTAKTSYADPVMKEFIDVATEAVFGTLWTRPGLDLKTRTLICVISDAATKHEAELEIHLRMALRQGGPRRSSPRRSSTCSDTWGRRARGTPCSSPPACSRKCEPEADGRLW